LIIKNLKLNNIRSYINQNIDFPKGNLLLSGNIGSGKTTLLLAIDFVLFGLRKGSLSGGSLLRHGEKEGNVELNFEIDGKNIVIKRGLKREKSGVKQSSGFIEIDGEMLEGTALQLKQKILELFNYPLEFLTKSKSLVYNYTVYTPQEEMKSILLSDAKERLNILRKVFGIDKYQRIYDNSKYIVKKLKDIVKENEFIISSLDVKKNEVSEKRARISELKLFIEENEKNLGNIIEKVNNFKKQLELIEGEREKRNKLDKEFEIAESNVNNFVNNKIRNNKLILELQEEINLIEESLKGSDLGDISVYDKNIIDKKEDILKHDTELRKILKEIYGFELKLKEANENKQNISNLNYCPTCKQNVLEGHKHRISEIEDLKIKDNSTLLKDYKIRESEFENIVLKLKKELEDLVKSRNNLELLKLKFENLDDKRKRLERLFEEQKEIKLQIGEMNVRKSDISILLGKIPNTQEMFDIAKAGLEGWLNKEKIILAEKARNENEFKILNEIISKLGLEIEKGEMIKLKIMKYSKLINFIDIDFGNLVQNMEKQIMKKVHSDFDVLFRDWFGILVNDVGLKVKLDYEFTPLIEQDGHDNDYLHLSGGEKTAIALSYRLALNKVINTVMSDINTRDLLILDEPTDGFSSEQVDKIRDVLELLCVEQTIIVSHDAKIESFVDNVLRFEKVSGVSNVIS
jgi:DNA repair protein SbcC/Rad50